MLYALVENGRIVEGPMALPMAWRNISGLQHLSPEELEKLGWVEVEETKVDLSKDEVIDRTVVDVVNGKVIVVETKRERTALEKFAAVSDHKLLIAIMDHVAGISSKSFDEYVAMKTAAIEVNPHDEEGGEVVVPRSA